MHGVALRPQPEREQPARDALGPQQPICFALEVAASIGQWQNVAADSLVGGLTQVVGNGVAEFIALGDKQVPHCLDGSEPLADGKLAPGLLGLAAALEAFGERFRFENSCAHIAILSLD